MLENYRKIIIDNMTKLWVSYCMPKFIILDTDKLPVKVEDVWINNKAEDLYNMWAELLKLVNKDLENEFIKTFEG